MEVLKFEDYIKEGFLSKTLGRTKHGSERLEDRIIINYRPKTRKELREIIDDLLKERGDNADLNDIDVSNVDDLSNLFAPHPTIKNINISLWNVSNVKNMETMFYNCFHFNCDLSNWDVSNVINMNHMFYGCHKFTSDISDWDVSKVEDMHGMFALCRLFNHDLSNWDVSSVKKLTPEVIKYIFTESGVSKLPKWI